MHRRHCVPNSADRSVRVCCPQDRKPGEQKKHSFFCGEHNEIVLEVLEGDVYYKTMAFGDKLVLAMSLSRWENPLKDAAAAAAMVAACTVILALIAASPFDEVLAVLAPLFELLGVAGTITDAVKGIYLLADFVGRVRDAQSKEALDEAGQIWAQAVVMLGVDALFAFLARYAGKKNLEADKKTIVKNDKFHAENWEETKELIGKPLSEVNLPDNYTLVKLQNGKYIIRRNSADDAKITKLFIDENGLIQTRELPSINNFTIINGKIDGKIPVAEYKNYRTTSIKNKESDTMTFGRYRPTVDKTNTEDWSTPGPDSYIVRAGKTTYFSLGDDWKKIIKQYGLDDKGQDMFKYFNCPAIDDAIKTNKEIRFSHDPRLKENENSALRWEWEYLKQKYGYTRIKLEGEFWYAKK